MEFLKNVMRVALVILMFIVLLIGTIAVIENNYLVVIQAVLLALLATITLLYLK